MGAPAPYFSVYPLPAKLPTNAAILASQHMSWEVTVVDGSTALEVVVEPFASALAIRPVGGWPTGRSLEVVARLHDEERRHPFETASMSHDLPPRCEWPGPSKIHPKSAAPQPDMWPTNMPRPPHNERTFSLPLVVSTPGYLVLARLTLTDRGRTWSTEVGVSPSSSTTIESGHPAPFVALTPGYEAEFSDDAQIIGVTLVDVAGNQSSYGTT